MSRIIFSGLKGFGGTTSTMEVTIVEHANHDVFEVILEDKNVRIEEGRVFVGAQALYEQIEIESGQVKKNQPVQHGSPGGVIIAHTYRVPDKAVSTFIFDHLFIKVECETAKIEVRSDFMNHEHNELVVSRPANLPMSASPARWPGTEPPVQTPPPIPQLRLCILQPADTLPIADRDSTTPTKLSSRSGTIYLGPRQVIRTSPLKAPLPVHVDA
jgi:hypothetical protein